MKKIMAVFFMSAIVFLIFTPTSVSAKVLTSKEGGIYIAENEVVDDDLFIGAQTVNIEGVVNGNVFIGAQTVKVTGTINGNLYVGAGTIYLGGKIKGSVYGGGQSILISGSVIDGSLFAGGATVDIDKDSSIGGSVFSGAGAVTIDSPVKRNVYAGTGSLTVGENAKIGRDLYYTTGESIKKANISKTAQIAGVIYKKEVDTPKAETKVTKKQALAAYTGFKFASTLVSFIATLIVAYIYLRFFNNDFSKTSELVEKSFWKCFGIGFLLIVGLVPALIFLFISIVGIPLAGLTLLLFGLYTYLSKIVVGRVFGNWLAKKFNWKLSAYWVFVVGLVAIYILRVIPVVGFLTGFAVLWSGLGAYAVRFVAKK